MSIGIIGAGVIGSAIARVLTRSGIDVAIANRRGPESLRDLEQELAPHLRAVGIEEAAQADIVFVAVNWSQLPSALANLGNWGGRIVIDTNNPIEPPLFQPIDLGTRSSSEVFAELVPGARVVKAFNHLPPALLSGDPRAEGGQRVLFLAGDDTTAKHRVATLIDRLGFFSLDLGDLKNGGRLQQFPGGALPTHNLVRF